MRNIEARRRRTIVGPTSGERARAAGETPARLPFDPEPVAVCGWENEGGARRPGPGGEPLEGPPATSRPARQG